MAEIVQGLFGVSPESLNAQRAAALDAQALKYAALDPFERATYGIYKGASQLGTGVAGLMGAQDPEMQKASFLRGLSQQYDPTTVAGLTGMVEGARKAGYGAEAMQAGQALQKLQQQQAELKKTTGEAGAIEYKAAQDVKLRDALSKLGANPTQEQIVSVVAQYGSPDKVLAVVQGASDKEAARTQALDVAKAAAEAKVEAAREQGATKLEIAKLQVEGKKEIASLAASLKAGSTGIQQELQQQRLEDLKTKAAEKQRATEVANQGRTASFDTAIDTLGAIVSHPGKKDVVGKLTGSTMAMIPGTDAAGFAAQFDTFKAQSFLPQVAALKGMGALSDVEGKKLTDAVGALSTKMKPAEFDAQVNKITNDLKAARNRVQATNTPGTPATPAATKRWNPQTQKLEAL